MEQRIVEGDSPRSSAPRRASSFLFRSAVALAIICALILLRSVPLYSSVDAERCRQMVRAEMLAEAAAAAVSSPRAVRVAAAVVAAPPPDAAAAAADGARDAPAAQSVAAAAPSRERSPALEEPADDSAAPQHALLQPQLPPPPPPPPPPSPSPLPPTGAAPLTVNTPSLSPTASPSTWCVGRVLPRYIRVSNEPVGDYVTVNEIVALDKSGANVALGKACSESSVYRPPGGVQTGALGFGCATVVDGARSRESEDGFFHSGGKAPGEFVEVDLGAAQELTAIEVYNRNDAAWTRLEGQRLLLLDAQHREVFAVVLSDVLGGQTFRVGDLVCPSTSSTPTATRSPVSLTSTQTASLSYGASTSRSWTATSTGTPARTPSPSPLSAAEMKEAAAAARVAARDSVAAAWALPRLTTAAAVAGGAAARAAIRVHHMQAEPSTGSADILDAYLSPALDQVVLLFRGTFPLDYGHSFVCGGALADLPLAPPEFGHEMAGEPRACGSSSIACDSALNGAGIFPPWWTFRAPLEEHVPTARHGYRRIALCPLPAVAIAALRAQRAATALASATLPRTGLVIEVCLQHASLCEAVVRRRVIAVDTGPAVAQHGIAMWTMLYNKESEVVAWLSYYLALGVEHFYLYDQMSTDSTYAQLMPFVQAGVATLIRANFSTASQCDPKNGAGETQDLAVNHLYTRWGAFNRWILLMDTDEYLVFPGGAAGDDWFREQAGLPATAAVPPVRTLPQFLRALNSTPDFVPGFDALLFWSQFAAGIYGKDGCVRPPMMPVCAFSYATDSASIDHAHAKLMAYPAHVPVHGHMHQLAYHGNRMVVVPGQAAQINHIIGCHHASIPRPAPRPHIAACGAVTRYGLSGVIERFLELGLLEHAAGVDGNGGPPLDDDRLFLDGSGLYLVADRHRGALLRDDSSLRSGRCATAALVFRNQAVKPVRAATRVLPASISNSSRPA